MAGFDPLFNLLSNRSVPAHRYRILEMPPDDAFDDITDLVTRVLRVPAAAVAITDSDRIWFESRPDLSEPEIDRNSALCTLTGPADGAWSITDAALDPSTRFNPIIQTGSRIRGYAAAPLRTHDGHTVGALCALDTDPHDFTADDLAILTSLAALVLREFELRLASRRAVFNQRVAPQAEPPAVVPRAGALRLGLL